MSAGPHPDHVPAESLPASPPSMANDPPGDPLMETWVKRLGKGNDQWVLLVYAEQVRMSSLDGSVRTILRSEIGQHLSIVPSPFGALLTLRAEKIGLMLDVHDVEGLRRHLGADLKTWAVQLSRQETKTSLWSGLGLSAAWFLLGGGLILGVLALTYLLEGIGRLLRGGRWLFLVPGLRAISMSAAVAIDVLVFGVDWWFGLFGLLFALGARASYRRFLFFRSSRD